MWWSFRSTFFFTCWSHRHKKCSTNTISIARKKSSTIFLHSPHHPLSSQKKRARLVFAPGQRFRENLVPQQKVSYVKHLFTRCAKLYLQTVMREYQLWGRARFRNKSIIRFMWIICNWKVTMKMEMESNYSNIDSTMKPCIPKN